MIARASPALLSSRAKLGRSSLPTRGWPLAVVLDLPRRPRRRRHPAQRRRDLRRNAARRFIQAAWCARRLADRDRWAGAGRTTDGASALLRDGDAVRV